VAAGRAVLIEGQELDDPLVEDRLGLACPLDHPVTVQRLEVVGHGPGRQVQPSGQFGCRGWGGELLEQLCSGGAKTRTIWPPC
jgi:hypothetical protein